MAPVASDWKESLGGLSLLFVDTFCCERKSLRRKEKGEILYRRGTQKKIWKKKNDYEREDHLPHLL